MGNKEKNKKENKENETYENNETKEGEQHLNVINREEKVKKGYIDKVK